MTCTDSLNDPDLLAVRNEWMQRFDDLCAIELPEGFSLDIALYVTEANQWGYIPGLSLPPGEWWLMEDADNEIMSIGGTDPVAELGDPDNKFSAAYIATWTGPFTVAREMVKGFLANKVQVSEMLARIEPEVQRRPIVLDLVPVTQIL